MKTCNWFPQRPIHLAMMVLAPLLASQLVRAGNLEDQLTSDYVGKTITLRQFYTADRLQFDPDGKLQGNSTTGPWTLYSQIAVEKARLEHGSLALAARRVQIMFDSGKQVDLLTSIQNKNDKTSKELAKELRNLKVEIEIQLPAGQPDQKQIDSAIHHVFLADSESIADLVPGYWQSFLGKKPDQPNLNERVYKIDGRAVKGPHARYAPDPPYSEEARRAKFSGTLVLWLVVSSEGAVKDVRITNPLGLGLDEQAVQSVSEWRFDPGIKDDAPVATMVNVEVSFRLY